MCPCRLAVARTYEVHTFSVPPSRLAQGTDRYFHQTTSWPRDEAAATARGKPTRTDTDTTHRDFRRGKLLYVVMCSSAVVVLVSNETRCSVPSLEQDVLSCLHSSIGARNFSGNSGPRQGSWSGVVPNRVAHGNKVSTRYVLRTS